MNDNGQDQQLSYADKIAKLLRKAESTDSPLEAEQLTAKAQALMLKYAIDEALLAAARGEQLQDEIVKDTVTYTGIYHRVLFNIGWAIVQKNNCKGLITTRNNSTILTIVGFKSDVMNVKVLDASLQVQASTAMQRWYRTQGTDGLDKMTKFKMRRQFFMSFAQGLGAKLALARRAGLNEAVADEAGRSGVTEDVARKSTDLVLRTKDEQVQDWFDHTYAGSLRSVRRNYASGGYRAAQAGYQAGMSANLGDPSIGTSRRQIGR